MFPGCAYPLVTLSPGPGALTFRLGDVSLPKPLERFGNQAVLDSPHLWGWGLAAWPFGRVCLACSVVCWSRLPPCVLGTQ